MRIKRFIQSVPPEVWALLLILIPLAWRVLTRTEIINFHPADLRGPNDPDPWLRLTLVRDWLTGGGWFNHEVLRSNAPDGGISTPWTRPLDLVIAGLVKLQLDSASLDIKLLRAAALLPMIWMTALLLGIFRAIRQLNGPAPSYLMASLLVATMPLVWNYFGHGNADHHAPLAALWTWAISYSLSDKPRTRDCWIQGAILAVMLWISPEALVLIALLYALPLLRWLRDGTNLWPLTQLTTATAYATVAALIAERAPGTWTVPIYDSISIVHVVLLASSALLLRVLALLEVRLTGRLIAGAMAGLVLFGIMESLYPLFFHGPMAQVDPYIFTNFLPRIVEAKPLFTKSAPFVVAALFLPIVALLTYGWMLRTPLPFASRSKAFTLIAILSVTLAMCVGQQRWNYYLFPVLAIMLAPVLGSLFAPDGRWPSRLLLSHDETSRAARRMLVLAILLATPLLLLKLNPSHATENSRRIDRCEAAARRAIYSGELAKALGDKPLILYAPTNLGSEILFFTPYRILASNYHREGKSIRYVWGAWKITNSNELQRYFAQRKVDALLLCPDTMATKTSALNELQQGQNTYPWLRRISVSTRANTPMVYRILK